MELFTDTPMGKAVMEVAELLSEEAAVSLEGAEPGTYRAFVFGGAAVHLYTNARGSADVDVEIEAVNQLDLSDTVVVYEDEDGNELTLVLDDTFNPTISGLLHEEYQEDAVPLYADNDSPLWVYVVTPVDLAVSKLGRLADVDESDIVALAKAGKLSADELDARGKEALVYAVGNDSTLSGHLMVMVRELRQRGF